MGGEKLCPPYGAHNRSGSPPRGRGKGGKVIFNQLPRGITPAWAGKSTAAKHCASGIRDHPRVGGEKLRLLVVTPGQKGSPPRGRGKAWLFPRLPAAHRITPAWAGKSWPFGDIHGLVRDHPRVGGEKTKVKRKSQGHWGSPPRGRGKAPVCSVEPSATRITPAWAGKRLKRSHRSGIFISGPIPFHSVLHRPAGSGGSRAGRDGSLAGQPQNAGPA